MILTSCPSLYGTSRVEPSIVGTGLWYTEFKKFHSSSDLELWVISAIWFNNLKKNKHIIN